MAFLEQILGLNYQTGPANVQLTQLVAPAAEPVTMEEVKAHLKAIEGNLDDPNIPLYVAAARQIIEKVIQKCIFTQTWEQIEDSPKRVVQPRRRPLLTLNSVSFILDWTNDTPVVVNPSSYIVTRNQIIPRTYWPIHRNYQAFILNYDSGMVPLAPTADAAAILAAQALFTNLHPMLKLAILLYVGHFFENREGQGISSRYEHIMSLNIPVGELPKDVRAAILDYIDWRP